MEIKAKRETLSDCQYVEYMRTTELLSLQKKPVDMLHRDEMLFQIVHQSTELWLKLSNNELKEAVNCLKQSNIEKTTAFIERSTFCIDLITKQLEMLEFMTPWDFQKLRPALGRGSGFESPGWKSIQKTAHRLYKIFSAYIVEQEINLVEIYKNKQFSRFFYLSEAMISWDETVSLWRARHYKLAVRTIGLNTVGTKGTPIEKLTHLLNKQFFPYLWNIRTKLTNESTY